MIRCMRRLDLLLGALGTAIFALPGAALAQGHGGVSHSGMDQGEARISARSDVRLSMESMPGTSGAAVSALGTRVASRMAQVRGCYEDAVAENPSITGTLRLRLLLERRGRPRVEVDRDAVNNAALVRCISGVLRGVELNGLRRPTHAIVQLEFANTAARGSVRARERAQQARQVRTQVDSEGNATSNGGTPDARVRFTVTGQGRDSSDVVAEAHRALLTSLPGLLDCRRRAGRRDRNQAGEISVTMRVHRGRPPASVVGRSTVEDERARGCVRRVLRRNRHRSENATGRVRVRIQFASRERAAEN